MRELLESLAGAGQPSFGPSRAELGVALRVAQHAHFRAVLGRAAEIDEATTRTLRTHAGYLDLLATEVGTDQASDAYFVAGTIYEWLATLSPSASRASVTEELTGGVTGDLLRAALCYSSGRHEAAAAVAARRASRNLVVSGEDEAPFEVAERAIAVILRVLGRDYDEALSAYLDFANAVRRLKAEPSRVELLRPGDWSAIGLVSRLAQTSAIQALAMRSGAAALAIAARERVAATLVTGSATPNADIVATGERLGAAFDSMSARSTFRLLVAAAMAPNRASYYAGVIPELWTSQVEAVEAGALDPASSFVLSLPTGSGKSLLAQLRIVAALDRSPDSWVAYVVPTRALTRQAHMQLARDLRSQGVRVRRIAAQAEAGLFVEEDELPAVVESRTCVVLTPERLDLYVRSNPRLMDSCALVVVDEIHVISEGDRGLRLEALIALIRTRWPDLPFFAMSAFLPDVTAVQEWLGDDAGAHRTSWRPTRQLRGLFARHSEIPLPDQYIYRVGARNVALDPPQPAHSLRKRMVRRKSFQIGALLASTPDDITGTQAFAVGRLARGETWTERTSGGEAFKSTTITELAAQVGAALSTHPGLVLLFLTTPLLAESTARKIANELPENARLNDFAEAVEEFLGADHDLVNLLRHGCAYHHAQLPDEVLRIIEAAALSDELQVLCATSGLTAGVNLPASIVVVVGDPSRQRNPSVRDFSNMAGRAGRPMFDTEGVTLYLPASIAWRRRPLEGQERRYLMPEDADIELESVLARVLDDLSDEGAGPVPLESLPDAVQQVLLALHAADLTESSSIERFLGNTFAVPAGQAGRLSQQLARTLERARDQSTDLMGTFAETALPYAVCLDLERVAVQDPAIPESAEDQAVALVEQVYGVDFFRSAADAFLSNVPAGQRSGRLSELIRGWVSGADYEALRSALGGGQGARLGTTVKVVGNLALLYGWGVGALVRILQQRAEATSVDPMLPYYIKFGVTGAVAAYLRMLGLSDRKGSMELATAYPGDRDVDLRSVEEWTQSDETAAKIADLFENQPVLRASVQGDLGIGGRLVPPVQYVRIADVPEWMVSGTVVTLTLGETGTDVTEPLSEMTFNTGGRHVGVGATYVDRRGVTRVAYVPLT